MGTLCELREWSLITARGATEQEGGRTTEQAGGQVKFYPYKNRRAENILAMLKGGHNKF